jgi:hypothetical protein
VGVGASPAAVRGVWQRHGLLGRYQWLLWLERKLDFEGVARRVFHREFDAQFRKAFHRGKGA